jgi:hypothetical protein
VHTVAQAATREEESPVNARKVSLTIATVFTLAVPAAHAGAFVGDGAAAVTIEPTRAPAAIGTPKRHKTHKSHKSISSTTVSPNHDQVARDAA